MSLWTQVNISLILLEYQEESKRKSKSCPSYAATTHFNIPLPEGATVLDTENDLREFTASHPNLDLEIAKEAILSTSLIVGYWLTSRMI